MTQTIKNLAAAFIGESQARNRYTFYSKIAKKEGYEQIAEIFLITAENEKEHASWLFKMIKQLNAKEKLASVTNEAESPLILGTTIENLQSAIDGEKYEFTKMYPQFAKIAKKEGLTDIAKRLLAIAKAEEHHHQRFGKLLTQLKKKTVFKKEKAVWWVCRECGYLHYGKEPPKICPSCDHPQGYYQVQAEIY